ncbi:MAG: hypothetical protein PUI21_04890 [Collinsella sp.]|nr:hypothetical protein [Collinsella sp.]
MPWQTGDIVAILSLLLSCLIFAASQRKDSRAAAAHDQLINDKLDRNNEMSRETRDAVRDMTRKLDDHGERITRVEQRVAALEDRADRLDRLGGTE